MKLRLSPRLVLALSFAAPLLCHAQEPAPLPGPASAAAPAPPAKLTPVHDIHYTSGIAAMNAGRWSDAIAEFDKSAAASPRDKQAALYWKAYSLAKLGRKDDANAICEQLNSGGEGRSVWRQDCSVLRVENGLDTRALLKLEEKMDQLNVNVNPKVRVSVNRSYDNNDWDWRPEPKLDANDEIKLVALNALLQQEPDKAMPIFRSIIFSDKPAEMRRRALYMLALSKNPAAQAMLDEAARDTADPNLQGLAVQTLILKGKPALPQLKAIYLAASTQKVKRSAMSMLFAMGDATDLVDLARSEKDLEMKRELVSQIALMKDPAAIAYMEELLK